MTAYYNEIVPFAAQWLRNLIDDGQICPGEVDERSIVDVKPSDLAGYDQCHFFAGVGGWSVALRKVQWPDKEQVWTGSCPCQPWSEAGQRKGKGDDRHLWPAWFRLIRKLRPNIVFGEQVPEAIKLGWLDEISSDLEAEKYAIGAAVISGCVVEAPQERERLWFVAHPIGIQTEWPSISRVECDSWPTDQGMARVAHGVPGQAFVRCAYGNAIIPGAAADFIVSALDAVKRA